MNMRQFGATLTCKRLARLFCASWLVVACSAALPSAFADADIRRDAAVEAIQQVMPCVVNVATESLVELRDPFEELFRDFWRPYHRQQVQKSLGSGVIIDEDGYILTNLHVVNRAHRIQIKLSEEAGGKEYDVLPITWTSQTDVALLKIIPPKGEKLPKFKAITFAKDDDLLLGETVLSLGNPFGLGGSVSRGILSSKRRAAPKENEELNVSNWLQTDAAINPGNSGGPLINLRGELIGINVAILPGAQGIGFAIPVKEVREALAKRLTPETGGTGRWFGAQFQPASSVLAVSRIEPGSPADKGGLRAGDVVLQVNGKTPKNFIELSQWLREESKPEFNFSVQRGSERRDVAVRLVPFSDLLRHRLGADLQELNPELAKQYGLEPGAGLLVAGVEKNGPADNAQLKRHYLIVGIGGSTTGSLQQAAEMLSGKKNGEEVEVVALAPQIQGGMILGYRQGTAGLKLR